MSDEENSPLEIFFYKFDSLQEFNNWKEQEEISSSSKYVQHRGVRYNKNKTEAVRKYYCHRSGVFVSKNKGKRSLKVTGSCKIDKNCPSFIRAVFKEETVEITYCNTHSGHEKEVKYLPIPKNVQDTIADQVKSGVPPRVVIDQLRNDFDNNVEKKNLTRKDVYNISSKYGLLHKYKLHAVDALSVDLQVKRYAETSLNPIIFYKTQGTEHFPLEVNDFMLIILTETQKEVLKKFGDQKLCIDCIYGPNQYNFNLTTILVIDEFGEGYPAAFCISTKIDEVHMMVFFSKLKEVIGCLAPNVFMSDDAPAFWNAWVKIMSSIPKFHLLCKWHVNNNWRKHLKKIDGAQMVKADIYKILHVLLEESDQTQFEFLLNSFLSKLDEEPVLHGFKAYFVSHYVPHKKLWAACYRHKVMIHNINVLEAFHKVLKHVYLKGKKNQRLDMLLWNLLKIVRDKNFERLIKLCDVGKVTHYLNAINDSHQSAVRILSSKIHKITNITWTVASESQEQDYLVTKLESCACKVICVVCDICVHSFKCTCYDYTIKNNMCKHIHAVQMNMSDDEESTQTVNINPIKTDEMCLKISSEQQLHKINLSLDSNLKVLFEEEGNVLVKNKN